MRPAVLSRALLGLIAAEPMSGYGLARLFERTLARAWPARHPQIYPALAVLEEEGLLRVSEEGPRRRKTYSVTEEGVAEVQRWLRETTPDRTVRNEAILRIFVLWLLPAAEAVAYLDDEVEEHSRRLESFERTLEDDERQRAQHGAARGGTALCASLALEWGLRYEREYVDWARSARDRIEADADGWDAVRRERLREVESSFRGSRTGRRRGTPAHAR